MAERPSKQAKKNYCMETSESIAEERRLKRESNGFFEDTGKEESPSNLLDTLFDN